jgi:4-amino-4-deoxy-L-arabinose transferase-like glycosyltransferase
MQGDRRGTTGLISAAFAQRSERNGPLRDIGRWLWPAIIGMTLWRIAVAWGLPVTLDEAYYYDWARNLAWGYFDHPPGVALLGIGTRLIPASALAARMGTVLAATLTLLVLLRFYRACGLRAGADLLLALVLSFATLPGLVSGVVTTPDTVLALCWAIALHEGLAALRGSRWRWLTAGLATGLGLLGKYPMVLIGPVFLLALLWADPRALRTRWPYLGGLAALLVFLPNVLWNAENHWVTMRFQLGHGFAAETGALVRSPLPSAVRQTPPPERATPHTPLERIQGVTDYLATQGALWGFILVPLILALVPRRGKAGLRGQLRGTLDQTALKLLVTATFVPLGFFGLIASFSDIEPNWPGVYLLSAAPLAAIALRRTPGWTLAAAGLNVVVISVYVLYAATGFPPLPARLDRITRETHGYQELASRAAKLDAPVFADRYQLTAMLRFYAPDLNVGQWPGITRPSEYLLGTAAQSPSLTAIDRAGGFYLVTSRPGTPTIPGFRMQAAQALYDCREPGVDAASAGGPPCKKPVHIWHLLHYRPAGPGRNETMP